LQGKDNACRTTHASRFTARRTGFNQADVKRASLLIAVGLAVGLASPAQARDYCPDRPGIDTPPCTIDPGRLSIETGVGDWTHEADPDAVTDTVLIGDLLMRYGIADHAELRVSWTAFGHVRTRDKASGAVERQSGIGDVTLGIRRNLIDPDGKQFSIALLPSVSLPAGGAAIGAGDWGAGLQVPASMPLGGVFTLLLTPEFDAAVNEDRSGRHFAWGSSGGIGIAATSKLNLALEASVIRDDDPAGHTTQALAGFSAGLTLGEETQIDVGAEIALNGASPDSHVYFGIARRF
jgi:opacity protein-like surface antigen